MGMPAHPPAPGLQLQPQLRLHPLPQLRALPGVLHSLRLLALGQGHLADTVEAALSSNPMLHRLPGSPCPVCGRHRRYSACPRCAGMASGPTADEAVRPFDTLEAAAGWEVRSDCRHAVPVVIAHLTGRGLLDCEPVEIARMHGLAPQTVREAVRAVKAAGPVGVAECSVESMLLAQARALVAAGEAGAWFIDLVGDHLADAVLGHTARVAAALGIPEPDVVEALGIVRARLRPIGAPDDAAGSAAVRVPPDVLVYRDDRSGQLEVDVADSRSFGVRLAAVASSVRADAEAMAWLAGYERSARDLIHQMDTRAGLLRRVATDVVQHQAGYFERGAAAQVPLTRTQVAADLGLHPSTVSRAVSGKLLRCPSGQLIRLADLFGGSEAVKARIVELCSLHPMSDAELSRALARGGHVVARRTVAKYRSELGIAAAGTLRRALP